MPKILSSKQRYMDIIPEPKTEYELWVRWRVYMSAKLSTLNAQTKKIKVTYE